MNGHLSQRLRVALSTGIRSGRGRAALLCTASVMALQLGLADGALAHPIGASASGTSAVTSAANAATLAAQQAAAVAKQSQAALLRAAQALQSLKAAQAAAAAAAAASGGNGVTDGLGGNGLIVDPRVTQGSDGNLWVNASQPSQTNSNGITTVTVRQTAQRAIMTWQQFNIGRNTILNFDQSGGNSANGNSWIALNRIDASGVPSQIQGQIKADGTVVIINPNGIIFTGTSQINVHTLVASSLDINSYSGSGVTNVGVFDIGNGSYVPVQVNGVTQLAANGTPLMAPFREDNGNVNFLSSGLYANSGGGLVLSAGVTGQPTQGIIVQPGATIATDISGFDNGGYVALVGSQVSNAGLISTASGQIILAAGSNILMKQPATGSNGTSLSLVSTTQQSIIYSADPVTGGAAATNSETGLLESDRGNITLYGDAVNQLGLASATTTVTRAGSINIYAGQLLTFGPNSVTSITPEDNGETIPSNSTSAFVAPSITINAANLDMRGNQGGAPGSLIVAPGATMTVSTATVNDPGGSVSATGRVLLESGSVINLAGLAAESSIDSYLYTFKVTANDVADSPLAQNLIGQTVTIDLRMSGTRADGLAWVGSPLFSATGLGYLNNLPQNITQLLTKGGSLLFPGNAGGYQPFNDVLQQSGSVVNIAGGALTFDGGVVATTRLLGADGRIYNIANASPFMPYDGIAGNFTVAHAHWSTAQNPTAEIFSSGLTKGGYFESGYIDGVSSGAISIIAANPVLEGSFVAAALTSSHQGLLNQAGTGSNGAQVTPDQLPLSGALTISMLANGAAGAANQGADAVVLQSAANDILGPDFTMASTLNLLIRPTATAHSSNGNVVLNTGVITYSTDALSAAGFGSISISSANALSMAKGASLSVQDGGTINLSGVSTIDGTLTARSGKITLTGFNAGTLLLDMPPSPQLTIGPDALLNVSGLWINDSSATGSVAHGPDYTNGGSVAIQTYVEGTVVGGTFSPSRSNSNIMADTTQSIVLASGSVIDLTGGGYVQANGKLKTGANGLPSGTGGSLSLVTYAGRTSNVPNWENPISSGSFDLDQDGTIAPNGPNQPNQANIFLNGTIYSGGLAGGGTFTLQAPTIQIGGVSAVTSYGASSARAGEIDLPASFFSSNSFSAYSLTSTYGSVTVAAGTTVLLQQQNYVLPAQMGLPATGASLRGFASLALAPLGWRPSVSLTLSQDAYAFGGTNDLSTNAGVLVDTGAALVGDPGAAISLTANGPVTVLGRIVAPGGSIALLNNGIVENLSQVSSGNSIGSGSTQAPLDVWIGPNAALDVGGVYVPNLDVVGYQTGSVLPGGSISLRGGAVIAMPGSMFDLAGTSATIQVPHGGLALGDSSRFTSQAIWSDGGTLTINSDPASVASVAGEYQTAYFDGTVNAAGGAALASGGTFIIGGTTNPYTSIIVSQTGNVTRELISSGSTTPPATAAALTALLPNANAYVRIGANTLDNSGFGSVDLMAGTIAFSGNVNLRTPGALTLAGKITLLPQGVVDPTVTPSSIGGTVVNVNAGYLLLAGTSSAKPTLSDGTINFNASSQIDLAGYVSVSNASNVNLTSGGDIRTVSESDPMFGSGIFGSGGTTAYFSTLLNAVRTRSAQATIQDPGALLVSSNLTLTARETYPATDAAFLLMSVGSSTGGGIINTVTVASNGQAPVAPLSADGLLLIDAPKIVQSGALLAPLGTIELGLSTGQAFPAAFTASGFTLPTAVVTQSLTLNAGSVTSVSANGLQIAYGTTINGTNWAASIAPTSANGNPFMSAPPAKNILLNGTSVNAAAGAVIDLSGGGDIYATEFVPGTGGSTNVLNTANQTVYAIVPNYYGPVAASDMTYGQNIAVGSSVTLSGGNGIAAGTYTLLPAIYATLPGAYRVTIAATGVTQPRPSGVSADGSTYVMGTLGNSITGGRSSQAAFFEIQSGAVWNKYSEIDITQGSGFFANLAAANGTVAPPLPADGGALTINATAALTLLSSFNFTPAPQGRGGIAAITGTNLLVLAPDRTAPAADVSAGYIVLNSDQLSNIGATTLLLGGTGTFGAAGLAVTASATNLEVDTDAAHPLTAPEVLLVSLAKSGANGLTVDAGSVVDAVGTVPSGSSLAITIGTGTAATASGSLLLVSNGAPVSVTRTGATAPGATIAVGTTPGTSTIPASPGAAVTINGNSLMLDTSGAGSLASNALLQAHNYVLSGGTVDVGNVPAATAALIISSQLIASFAGATTVTLRSGSEFNFYDIGGINLGSSASPIGTLTFDGAALDGDGGSTTIIAGNIDLVNGLGVTSNINALNASGGTLVLTAAGAVIVDAGTKSLGGFAQATFNGGQQIVFSGTGSLGAGSTALTLSSPGIVASAASVQSLTTTGALTILATGPAPVVAATNIGGAVSFTAGNINDSGNIVATAGKVSLTATAGDIVLNGGASISATGSHIMLFDAAEDAPAGSVQLVANAGKVTIGNGALIDVSGTGNGFGGTLTITTSGVATLNGTLRGGAAYGDMGGNFVLTANGLAGSLPFDGGFSRSFAVTLQQGDIDVPAGTTLASSQVTLTANGGSVVVDGTIDASGPGGGVIQLYGAGTGTIAAGTAGATGVTIDSTARLLATYRDDDVNDPLFGQGESKLVQNGGTIVLGTSGTTDGSLDATYGYENVAGSGAITVASGALLDVSGGAGLDVNGRPGGANISNAGGTIIVRAPILAGKNVNVSFDGTVVTNGNGGPSGTGVALDAYATWSTADGVTDPNKHFDGIIDPAGWFNPTATGSVQIAGTTNNGIFTPTGATNSGHIAFYQTTLVGFVQNPFTIASNVAASIVLTQGSKTFQIGTGLGISVGEPIMMIDSANSANTLVGTVSSYDPTTGNVTIAATQVTGSAPSGHWNITANNAADFAGASGIGLGTTLHLRPEIDLINPPKTLSGATNSVNNGNITVASNWNLGAGTFTGNVYNPIYRTKTIVDAGEPGVLMLAAANNVQINATISDGFYEPSDPFFVANGNGATSAAAGPGNAIANNPGVNNTTDNLGNSITLTDLNTTSAASLMPISVSGEGSFSYDFVGGTAFAGGKALSVNPNAVITVGSSVVTTGANPNDSVTLSGHSVFTDPNATVSTFNNYNIFIPTLLRTGTGSITISAAGSFELLDTAAPGAVYTAGAAADPVANFTAPTLPVLTASSYLPIGMVTNPAWGTGGGAVTITTGASIVGIETPTDVAGTAGQTGIARLLTGEFWSAWYYVIGNATGAAGVPFDPAAGGIQNSAYINYGTFFQGVGALGGGNVRLSAGGNIDDMSASLPETIQVSGGQFASGPAATANYFGGGDLFVTAGGNLLSSTFYVGRGIGSIQVAGSAIADPANPITGLATQYANATVAGGKPSVSTTNVPLPLLLAQQDSFVFVTAGGALTTGAVFDPTRLPMDTQKLGNGLQAISGMLPNGIGSAFDSYGASSGDAFFNVAGDMSLATLVQPQTGAVSPTTDSLFLKAGSQTALASGSGLGDLAAPQGSAGGSENRSIVPANLQATSVLGNIIINSSINLLPAATGTIDLMAGQSITTNVILSARTSVDQVVMLDSIVGPVLVTPLYNILGTKTPSSQSEPLHADDPAPVIIYAGKDINGYFNLIKPAEVQAGRDIVNTNLITENNSQNDITSVIAGRDIVAQQTVVAGATTNNSSTFVFYGPGDVLVQAGRNLGPFFTGALTNATGSITINGSARLTSGIMAVGDGSNLGTVAVKAYLPVQGANLYTLFGVGPGINYAAAIADYVDPANAGSGGIDFLTYVTDSFNQTLANAGFTFQLSRTDAWVVFELLPTARQHLLVDQAYLKFLSQVGLDYNDQTSTYYHQYARAYQAISTLFPASLGYTDNTPTGDNGQATAVHTGDLSMAHSLLDTQTGGNIYLLGPGGNIIVGANAADTTPPNQEGILTLQGGSILSYTDRSVQVYQSRIFTEQGGDIDMFTANGDLNAGKGPKSKAAFPPLSLIWDPDSFTRVNPAGLVTGSGIGALLSVPGQDPSLSNVNLVAPRGTVDAGAAGIRVSGNLNIAALQVLNAFNIQVNGTSTGIPVAQGPNVGAALTGSNTSGAAVKTAELPKSNDASETASIIIVEFLGFGGGDGDTPGPDSQRRNSTPDGRQGSLHDPARPVQVIGGGALNPDERSRLTATELKNYLEP